jgi:hypothetical protein
MLYAAGLFRLDVEIVGDTLRTVIRNLSPGELRTGDGSGGYSGVSYAFGDVSAFEPSRTELHFTLGAGADTVTVDVLLATLRFPDRGALRVTAQAIVRQAEPSG